MARGERVKVSELYKGRASLLNYAASSADLTLRLDELKHNDTGFYRCEVQHGLEDAHDQAQVKVKGYYYLNYITCKDHRQSPIICDKTLDRSVFWSQVFHKNLVEIPVCWS